MKNLTKPRRSSWGTKTAIIASILFAILSGCGHDRMDTDANPPNYEATETTRYIEVLTTNTTATTTLHQTTTMTMKLNTTTTTAVTTLKIDIPITTMNFVGGDYETTDIYTEYNNDCESVIETTTANVENDIIDDNAVNDTATETGLPITDQEFILLCNLVSHEAGSSWITEYDRACIVAATMNRVADSRFPNTIDEVVHQPGQMFNVPYYRVDYSTLPREEIDNAVYAYFNGKYEFGNFNSWSGDGTNNYFYYQ